MSRLFYYDLAERAAWTFAQAFFAAWMVTQQLDKDTLLVAITAGMLAVAKAVVAGQFGAKDSAATLPEHMEPLRRVKR
jgi:heme A synthase